MAWSSSSPRSRGKSFNIKEWPQSLKKKRTLGHVRVLLWDLPSFLGDRVTWDSCWLNQHRIPLQLHFPCILPIWRCLSWTKGCMTSPVDPRQASPVWQVLSAASPSSSQFVATRRLYYFPLPSILRAHLEHYWDGLSKTRVQQGSAIPRRLWWQNSARDRFPFQVHKYCIL